MILPIYLYGSEVLRQKAVPADLAEKEKIAKLVADMEETLTKSEGCGLAAPQVGESVRILIVDGTGMTDVYPYLADFKRVMINPVILSESEKRYVLSLRSLAFMPPSIMALWARTEVKRSSSRVTGMSGKALARVFRNTSTSAAASDGLLFMFIG